MKMYRNPLNNGKLRNSVCPCGTGLKVKNCHGRKAAVTEQELVSIVNMVNRVNNQLNETLQERSYENS